MVTTPISSLFDHAAPQEDAGQRPTIIAVCTGNICRSPLAEVILKARLRGSGVLIRSAGTHALVGHGMPSEAQQMAIGYGAADEDVQRHRAQLLQAPLLKGVDLILAMAAEHRFAVLEMSPGLLHRTFTAREFGRLTANLGDEELRVAANLGGNIPRARLAAMISYVAQHRGGSRVLGGDDDVIDPYRRPRTVYEESAAQLAPGLVQAERIVRLARL